MVNSTSYLGLFLHGFQWENRDEMLDDFPLMNSLMVVIGEETIRQLSLHYLSLFSTLAAGQLLSFFLFFYTLYGPHSGSSIALYQKISKEKLLQMQVI